MSQHPTLRDVARLAEVSIGTASQALNNKPGVVPETRAKVLRAAETLGYVHRSRLQPPPLRTLSTIGLLMRVEADEEPGISTFYTPIIAAAARECQRQGLSMMYAAVETDEKHCPRGYPPMLNDKRIDGFLVVGVALEGALLEQIQRQVHAPLVLVDAYAPGAEFDSILSDNLNGAIVAVNHLVENGHVCIGLIGSSPDDYPSIQERRAGYLRALAQHNITETYIEDGPLTRQGAYDATLRLLRRAPEVTAIFGCNDRAAIRAMLAARDLGLGVPDDVSVVGYDDIDAARETSPPLTTMRVDKVFMGVLAVRQLRDRLENPDRPALTVTLNTQLTQRKSVRCLIGAERAAAPVAANAHSAARSESVV